MKKVSKILCIFTVAIKLFFIANFHFKFVTFICLICSAGFCFLFLQQTTVEILKDNSLNTFLSFNENSWNIWINFKFLFFSSKSVYVRMLDFHDIFKLKQVSSFFPVSVFGSFKIRLQFFWNLCKWKLLRFGCKRVRRTK